MLEKLQHLEEHWSCIAYIYSVIGNIALVCMQISMKLVVRTISSSTAIYIRGAFILITNTLYLWGSGQQVSQSDSFVHNTLVKKSVTGSTGMVIMLVGLIWLPIGILNSLFNTAPLIIFFL
jgi:hypothetical protein